MSTSAEITLDGSRLEVEAVVRAARSGARVDIAAEAVALMSASRAKVEEALRADAPVYALNTGVGLLARVRLDATEIDQMQLNLVRSHCCGVGEPLGVDVTRAMMLIRVNILAMGLSGIRPEVALRLCDLLNRHITPVVPMRGSVGASGDLAPLAHMALALVGEGDVIWEGRRLAAAECFEKVGIVPLRLRAKEGISLLNGTQAMLAVGCLALCDLKSIFQSAQTATALTLQALRGTSAAYDERLHAARPHPGQVHSAAGLRELLAGAAHHESGTRVQDAYCLRCVPQVHGAVWDSICEAERIFTVELNSATDNPLLFGDDFVSGGNFHGAPLALALDNLAVALCQLAGISERRTERLMNPSLNEGLPAFLASRPGLESGLMMAQVTAAALIAEMRVLATPASACSIPTSGNQEDFVSMGMTAALKLQQSALHCRMVVAIEFLTALRALDLRGEVTVSPTLDAVRSAFRNVCPGWEADCTLSGKMADADAFLSAVNWSATLAQQQALPA
ncbi:MAG TPA: histidine ammonia-lyase [Acidobacteriaceae bacterium]|jgi:histidine ammonia-lyase|nr:histidine ammonia-lyase [Acidobacteriaceae bacterium]